MAKPGGPRTPHRLSGRAGRGQSGAHRPHRHNRDPAHPAPKRDPGPRFGQSGRCPGHQGQRPGAEPDYQSQGPGLWLHHHHPQPPPGPDRFFQRSFGFALEAQTRRRNTKRGRRRKNAARPSPGAEIPKSGPGRNRAGKRAKRHAAKRAGPDRAPGPNSNPGRSRTHTANFRRFERKRHQGYAAAYPSGYPVRHSHG